MNRFPISVRIFTLFLGLGALYLVLFQRPDLRLDMAVAAGLAMSSGAFLCLNIAFWPYRETGLRLKLMFTSAFMFLVGVTAIMGIGAGLVSFPSFLFFTSIIGAVTVIFAPNRCFAPCYG